MSKSITIEVPSKKTSVVAVKSSGGYSVVSHGANMKTVIEKARKAGDESPIIFHVPRQGQRYIY